VTRELSRHRPYPSSVPSRWPIGRRRVEPKDSVELRGHRRARHGIGGRRGRGSCAGCFADVFSSLPSDSTSN